MSETVNSSRLISDLEIGISFVSSWRSLMSDGKYTGIGVEKSILPNESVRKDGIRRLVV